MNYQQELKELVKLGKKMRHSQQTYFSNRKSHNAMTYLDKAKNDERTFDQRLKKLEIDMAQPKLGI